MVPIGILNTCNRDCCPYHVKWQCAVQAPIRVQDRHWNHDFPFPRNDDNMPTWRLFFETTEERVECLSLSSKAFKCIWTQHNTHAPLMTVRIRPFSNSYKALAVVPDGDVTKFRSTAGCSPVSIAYSVEPNLWYVSKMKDWNEWTL